MSYTFPDIVDDLPRSFGGTRELVGEKHFQALVSRSESIEALVELLHQCAGSEGIPQFTGDLAALEAYLCTLTHQRLPFDPYPGTRLINPSLRLFINHWRGLCACVGGRAECREPQRGEEQVIIWQPPEADAPRFRPVTDRDLLVLKMIAEGLSAEQVAGSSGASAALINSAVRQGLESGIILGPRSRIRRVEAGGSPANLAEQMNDSFTSSRGFALQWHITQACDLHCRHCYDRSPSTSLSLEQEISILDSFYEFCSEHHVFGQVSFTGGNPLLHPTFQRLYREAAERGFIIGILGNPATAEAIDLLMEIQPLSFYQMSLEGLEPHNDYIRGAGHFQRVLAFLDVLREREIYTKIMLTLTRDNLDQVIELGRFLDGRADVYTFNRLSQVGEGAALAMSDPGGYRTFLEAYAKAAEQYPIFDKKDNLFNIILDENGSPLEGGCTGYGCGAAFNFVAVLPTGEVHACRKFPSPIGTLTNQSLSQIYHSPAAERYRQGPTECSSCRLNPVCRGCMAARYSYGQDVLEKKDPYCFINGID